MGNPRVHPDLHQPESPALGGTRRDHPTLRITWNHRSQHPCGTQPLVTASALRKALPDKSSHACSKRRTISQCRHRTVLAVCSVAEFHMHWKIPSA